MKFLVKQKQRRAVSPVIATLLLIAIAVAAAIIVYAFVTGLIGGLTSSGASLVVVSGSLTVPSGSGAGTLVVTINNKASNAINYVTIATDAADTGLTISYAAQNGGPAGGSAAGGLPICVLAITAVAPAPAACQIAGGNPLATDAISIGSSSSAIGSVSTAGVAGATAGSTYTFTVAAYIGASSTPNLQTFSVTAQI